LAGSAGDDHVVVFGESHLRHPLAKYSAYYNGARTLRLTKMLRSTDLRRQWAVSNQFRGSAAFIVSAFGSHNW
jgi:hypothetical protein